MDQQTVQQILTQNRQTYQRISSKFSSTRDKPWVIMDVLIKQYVQAGQRILDVGCGNGRLLKLLTDKPIDYVGIDNNPFFIETATSGQQPVASARFIVDDVLNLDKQSEFDLIFCLAVLNHFPGRQTQLAVLNNLVKALKPGGYLLLTNWNLWQLSFGKKTIWRYKLANRQSQAKQFGFKDVMTYFKNPAGAWPLYYYAFTLGELKQLANSVGLEIKQAYYERAGRKAHWFNAHNLVLICQKK
ncbi:MAG: class I SAM-dependent methyltransferase [Patescibacteria group bacterium]